MLFYYMNEHLLQQISCTKWTQSLKKYKYKTSNHSWSNPKCSSSYMPYVQLHAAKAAFASRTWILKDLKNAISIKATNFPFTILDFSNMYSWTQYLQLRDMLRTQGKIPEWPTETKLKKCQMKRLMMKMTWLCDITELKNSYTWYMGQGFNLIIFTIKLKLIAIEDTSRHTTIRSYSTSHKIR